MSTSFRSVLASVDNQVRHRCLAKDVGESAEQRKKTAQAVRAAAAQSKKSGKWGPTHSMDSQDSSLRVVKVVPSSDKKGSGEEISVRGGTQGWVPNTSGSSASVLAWGKQNGGGGGAGGGASIAATGKSTPANTTDTSAETLSHSPSRSPGAAGTMDRTGVEAGTEGAAAATSSTSNQEGSSFALILERATAAVFGAVRMTPPDEENDYVGVDPNGKKGARPPKGWRALVDNACSPCHGGSPVDDPSRTPLMAGDKSDDEEDEASAVMKRRLANAVQANQWGVPPSDTDGTESAKYSRRVDNHDDESVSSLAVPAPRAIMGLSSESDLVVQGVLERTRSSRSRSSRRLRKGKSRSSSKSGAKSFREHGELIGIAPLESSAAEKVEEGAGELRRVQTAIKNQRLQDEHEQQKQQEKEEAESAQGHQQKVEPQARPEEAQQRPEKQPNSTTRSPPPSLRIDAAGVPIGRASGKVAVEGSSSHHQDGEGRAAAAPLQHQNEKKGEDEEEEDRDARLAAKKVAAEAAASAAVMGSSGEGATTPPRPTPAAPMHQTQQPRQQPHWQQNGDKAKREGTTGKGGGDRDARSRGNASGISPSNASSAFNLPLQTLEVNHSEPSEFERSISELTMRSSYGEATSKLTDNRRMAYYAVGRHHDKVNRANGRGRGGNRRCYFTGKLILGGAPFYAGSVQQGLRTLVVFCLPSAIGLPRREHPLQREESLGTLGTGVIALPRKSSVDDAAAQQDKRRGSARTASTAGDTRTYDANGSLESYTVDDMSLSLEETTVDPNALWDSETLLRSLPEPSQDLLDEMRDRYPDQFNTLPVQVRSPHCWRLFIKFCFFSGLPIAEGEMYYKVQDTIAREVYGEEIILSHEVMEAVNGEQSADILRLPNQKTFKYLRKHYTQQSGKLTDVVFQRKSWELVPPEF